HPLVFVADDDPELRQMLSAVLRAAGFQTETFENGKLLQQRALSDATPPDVIVTDIDMPRMDGLTAIAEIRKQYPELPIVVLSAIAEAPRVAPTAEACGASLVVSKPVGLVELRENVEALLARAERPRSPIDSNESTAAC
ncbi:MAG: response regulator, partial [Myxococcales bacterium]|nr:response regulator [Myxococcales bacterium]